MLPWGAPALSREEALSKSSASSSRRSADAAPRQRRLVCAGVRDQDAVPHPCPHHDLPRRCRGVRRGGDRLLRVEPSEARSPLRRSCGRQPRWRLVLDRRGAHPLAEAAQAPRTITPFTRLAEAAFAALIGQGFQRVVVDADRDGLSEDLSQRLERHLELLMHQERGLEDSVLLNSVQVMDHPEGAPIRGPPRTPPRCARGRFPNPHRRRSYTIGSVIARTFGRGGQCAGEHAPPTAGTGVLAARSVRL